MATKSHAAFAFLFSATSIAACGGEEPATIEEPITFEQFQALAFQEPDTGIYIYNGDETAQDLRELRTAYDHYVASVRELQGFGVTKVPLIVNTVSGQDDKWDAATAGNITYCVSQSSFGSRYNAVVTAMAGAAGAWESAADVNFVHSSGFDTGGRSSCNNRTNVVFNVRQVCSGQYLARAFFPSYSRRNRELLIDCTSFGNISPWTLEGVLRHELGHALGFRHEHTRPESGSCFENNSWRALTAYDSDSVMHYPQCNGTNNGDLSLTSLDRAGAGALYP